MFIIHGTFKSTREQEANIVRPGNDCKVMLACEARKINVENYELLFSCIFCLVFMQSTKAIVCEIFRGQSGGLSLK